MAERKSKKPTAYERAYRILEYLKENTDDQHTVCPKQVRENFKAMGMEEYIGTKNTFHDLIVNLANAMNSNVNEEMKPEDKWRIVFNDFIKEYGYDSLDESADDEKIPIMQIVDLYYNQEFTYDEINCLIEGIRFSRTLDTKTADQLVAKIENCLTSKYYKRNAKRICTVRESMPADKEKLRENLLTIQQAIDDRVQIQFQFNGYNYKGMLEPVRDAKDVVSPYYIVAYAGRYYLLAAKEEYRNTSIWRIDLMTEIEIPRRNDKLGIKGTPIIRKTDVTGLPRVWDETFPYSHLNMSFDEPIVIKLKIKSPKDLSNPTKRMRVDYTFLYDWFGTTFRYVETEKKEPYDDIVTVKCSPYAMENWALQYSDRVEVLEPTDVRKKVIEKLQKLCRKYGDENKNV